MKRLNNFATQLVALSLFTAILGCTDKDDSQALVDAVILESELNDGTLITSMEIQGSGARIREGESYQLIALGSDLNGEVNDVSNKVIWSSSEPDIASVDQTGLVKGLSNKLTNQGFIEITASTLSGVTATGTLSVAATEISSIAIIPPYADESGINKIYTCIDAQLAASVTYSDGVNHPVTDNVNWQLSGSNTAHIEAQGLLHTSSATAEDLLVTAELEGVSGSLTLSAITDELNTLYIYDQETQLSSISLQVGQRLNLRSLIALNAGALEGVTDITHETSWQANNAELLGITNQGIYKGSLLALKPGYTLIDASCSWLNSFVTVEISGISDFDSLLINQGDNVLSLRNNQSIDLQLLITYTGDTSPVNITEFVNWDLSNTDLVSAEHLSQGTSESVFRVTANNDGTGETNIRVDYDGETRLLTLNITN